MIARLVGRFAGNAFLGALFSLGIKVGGSVTALAMFALASWTMDVRDFGELVMVFNAVSLVAVVAVLGQDTLIQRSWGEYGEQDPDLAHGAVRFGFLVTLAGATVAVLLFASAASLLGGLLEGREIVAVSAFLFAQTLLHYCAHLTRVMRGIVHSEPPRELFWRLPILAALAIVLAGGGRSTIFSFFATAAIGQLITVAHLAIGIRRALPAPVRGAPPRFLAGEWARRGATMTTAAMAEAAHQYADVILIGNLVGPTSAAGYFVVVRIANIFAMLTSGFHIYSASKVSSLYWQDQLGALRRLLAQISVLILTSTAVLFTVIVLFGPQLLGIFGAEYRELAGELTAMSTVTGLTALAGPGPMLLLLMGADVLYLQLVAGSLLVRVVALVVLAPLFGIYGAVAAVAVAVVPLAIGVTVISIRRFGIDPSAAAIVSGRFLADRPRPSPPDEGVR